jgi:hypothetical protein
VWFEPSKFTVRIKAGGRAILTFRDLPQYYQANIWTSRPSYSRSFLIHRLTTTAGVEKPQDDISESMTKAVVWDLFQSELENPHMSSYWAASVIVECETFLIIKFWRCVDTGEFDANNLSCFYQLIKLFPWTCLYSRNSYEYFNWPGAAYFPQIQERCRNLFRERDPPLRNPYIF